ncbi:hypothetical protein [Microbacterium sp. NPDC055599]
MSDTQPNHRTAGATEIAGAVRRTARTTRSGQARIAQLLFDRYGWEVDRIAEDLDIDMAAATRLLAADGIHRCVECAFAFHRACLGELDVGVDDASRLCKCECDHNPALM